MAGHRVYLGCWEEVYSDEELKEDALKRAVQRRSIAVRERLRSLSNFEDDFGLHFLTDDEAEAEAVAKVAMEVLEANGFADLVEVVEIERFEVSR